MDQNRLKSPVVWAAVAAQILSALMALGLINAGLESTLNQVVAGLLQLLVLFGLLNNPTNSENF